MKYYIFVLVALVSVNSVSGEFDAPEVNISGLTASGSLLGARISGDPNQAIGCRTETDAIITFKRQYIGQPPVETVEKVITSTCYAVDSFGNSSICDARLFTDEISSINASSVISFTANASGDCVNLSVENTSRTLL